MRISGWRRQKGRLWGAFAVLALLLADLFLPLTRPFEFMLQDALMRVHLAERAPSPGVVLINIDEPSLEGLAGEYGRWPWSREVHARLLEKLLEQRPRAVVFDIVMSERNLADPAGDQRLIDAALPATNVFFPMVVLSEYEGREVALGKMGYRLGFEPVSTAAPDGTMNATLPLEPLAMTGRIGAINMLEDPDGAARRYHLHLERGGWRIPSLPVRVAKFLDAPIPEGSAIHLHWNSGPYAREYYSYIDVLRALDEPHDDSMNGLFTDTVVVIGGDAMGLYDLRSTPVSNAHPGADILATAIGNLLQQDHLEPVSRLLGAILGLVVMVGVFLAFLAGRGLLLGGMTVLAVSVAWLVSAESALSANLILPIMPVIAFPMLLFIVLGLEQTLRERAAREQAISTFGRFIDPRVARSLVREDSDLLDAVPQSREITVLFSDIRGFTTLSESRPPEEIVSILNRYFERQVEVIFEHGGTIDKFIGDAIMAFWGAPVDDPDQADNAVAAAMAMTRVVQEFRDELATSGIDFDIGIGLHTGPAVVGFIGSKNRLDYTVIGDTVNLASRIEGQTKGRARILVSEDTKARCRQSRNFIDHGSVTVKGRAREVTLYEPK